MSAGLDLHADSIASMFESLRGADDGMRSVLIGRLKEAYVTCDAESCWTNPEVAAAVLPHALRALSDPAPELRVAAVQSIELFAPDAAPHIQDLSRALSDPVAAVRLAAIEALGEFGPRAAEAAPAVRDLARSAPGAEERSAAADTLFNMGVPPPEE